MRHEEAEHITPPENGPPANDDAEILRGLEHRVGEILAGIRETRRSIERLAASERAAAIRELAGTLCDSGDAQHVARHALEALAAQLGGDAPTRRDLEAIRRRPRLSIAWGHVVVGLPGLASLVAGIAIHDVAKAPALIAAGASLLGLAIGHSFRQRSG